MRHVFLFLALALAALFAWREETSHDLGFHLGTGRWILEHHAWPRTDPFTYTVPGHAYVDMHGLFQIAVALADRVDGMRGIAVLRVAMILAAVALLWATARRRGVRSPELLGAGFALGICAWEVRFLARPELATFLLLAAEIYLLRRHAEDGRARWLGAVVALQAVWVYAHALSLFGIAVLGLYAAATLVDGLRRGRDDRAPWIALGGAAAVMLLNPYGPRGVAFLWELRTRLESGNVFGESIGELISPFSAAAERFRPLDAFKVLFVASGVAVLASLRRLSLFDLGLFALFGALAAGRVRNISLFVVATLPIALDAATSLSRTLPAWTRRIPGAWRAAGSAWLALAMIFIGEQVAGSGYYAADLRPVRFGHLESPANYPIGTVGTLQSLRLEGPIYNSLAFGGYLIAHRPREKVFIDGRLEVIGEEFYARHLAVESGAGWEEMVRRYQPNLALVAYSSSELARRIDADSGWALIDVDGVAALFARRIPAHRAAIESASARWRSLNAAASPDAEAFMPRPPRPWFVRLLGPRRFPFETWGRGNAMLVLQRLEAARREYRRALLTAGYDEPALIRNYAAVCDGLGRRAEALAWYERLSEIAPGDQVARETVERLRAGNGP